MEVRSGRVDEESASMGGFVVWSGRGGCWVSGVGA